MSVGWTGQVRKCMYGRVAGERLEGGEVGATTTAAAEDVDDGSRNEESARRRRKDVSFAPL